MTAPPLIGRALSKTFCNEERREEIVGDLEELFHRRVERHGLRLIDEVDCFTFGYPHFLFAFRRE